MQLLLRGSGDENAEGKAEAALLDVTEAFARDCLHRRDLARQANAYDEQFLRIEFWCYQVEWIGDDDDAPRDAVPASEFVEESLDKQGTTRLEQGDPVVMPDDFAVPEHLQQRTECDCLMVYRDEIHCSASVRHTDVQQETAAGPSDLIKVAAGFRERVAP
jgi:hypothetical protein